MKGKVLSIAAVVLIAFQLAGCGASLRAIDPGADKIPKLAEAARKIAPSAPKPLWSATIRAPETDILQFVSENRILVGEVRIGSGTPILPLATVPSTGPIALYDADSGRQIWTRPRTALPPGQYAVLATAPVILLLGVDAKKAAYTALDPETGAVRWEQTFSAPYAAVPSPQGKHFIVTSGGWFARKLSAVDIRSGTSLWERSFDKGEFLKDRPPLLTLAGDALLLAGKKVSRISPQTGADLWSIPSPLENEEAASATAAETTILITGKSRIALLDAGTGAVRWVHRIGDGTVKTALPGPSGVLLWIRTPKFYDRLVALGAENGRPLWTHDAEGMIQSSLLLSGKRFYYTIDQAIISRDLMSGMLIFRSDIPGGFGRWGDFALPNRLLPDLLELRGDAIVVARETFGVAKVSAETGKVLFARKIPRATTSPYSFADRASNLFGAYWSGFPKDLEPAQKRFEAAVSGAMENYRLNAQRTAGISVLVDRAHSSYPRDSSGGSAIPSFPSEQARREIAATSQAISREMLAGAMLTDPKVQVLAQSRSLARQTVRQESQARVTTLGAERAKLMVNASMESMTATIDLCNSVMDMLDSLGTAVRETQKLRRFVDLRHAVEIHRRSLQGRFYVRPFQFGEAQGFIVVNLETGDRADVLSGIYNRDMAKDFGVDLPQVAEAPGGGLLATKGIGLNPAAFESYSLSPFLFPYPSLFAFDARGLPLGKGPFDDPDIAEVAAKGDLAGIREFLAGGSNPESSDLWGNGAMVRAAEGGHAEAVHALLRAGARADPPDRKGKRPLHGAIAKGHIGIVRILIEKGVDVNPFDGAGSSPLFLAGQWGRPEIVGLLLSKGADVKRMHANPAWSVYVSSNIGKAFCKDEECRKRFDEAVDLLRKAGVK